MAGVRCPLFGTYTWNCVRECILNCAGAIFVSAGQILLWRLLYRKVREKRHRDFVMPVLAVQSPRLFSLYIFGPKRHEFAAMNHTRKSLTLFSVGQIIMFFR